MQRVAFGEARTEVAKKLTDINAREMLAVIPLAIVVVGIGVYPGPLLETMDASVTFVVERLAMGQ